MSQRIIVALLVIAAVFYLLRRFSAGSSKGGHKGCGGCGCGRSEDQSSQKLLPPE